MRLLLSSFMRLMVMLALLANVVAIGLGGHSPEPAKSTWRPVRQAREVTINGYLLARGGERACWLNAGSGSLPRVPLDSNDRLENVSVSSLQNEDGERQAVGRWARRCNVRDGQTGPDQFGLVRFAVPSGREIDRIPLDVLAMGPPCWYPGNEPRILFTGGDGALYHFSFDTIERSAGGSVKPPERIGWKPPSLEVNRLFFFDPLWPADPQLGGRLIVAVAKVEIHGTTRRYGVPHLWWLKLDRTGMEVESAGPLLVSDADEPSDSHNLERYPNVGTRSDGTLVVAYLTREESQSRWQLRVAPIDLDERSSAPRADRAESRVLAEDCAPTRPALSADGRSVTCLVHPRQPDAHAVQISLESLLRHPRAVAHRPDEGTINSTRGALSALAPHGSVEPTP
jgi:hypothetical protein